MVERVDVALKYPPRLGAPTGREICPADLINKFPRLPEWENGTVKPTMRQLENYAEATYTPFGYFFLPAPIQEPLPLPDFRTIRNEAVQNPSADLLETIYICNDARTGTSTTQHAATWTPWSSSVR